MKNYEVKGWLPIFPGFYGTIFNSEGDEDQELYNLNEDRLRNGLDPVGWDACEWDYDEYNNRVASDCTDYICSELEKLGLISGYEFEKLVSPAYYNFSNDSINVMYKLDDNNFKNIHKYLLVYKELFEDYLKGRYTSYDGFISSYSNNVSEWLTESFKDDMVDSDHKLSSVFGFICENEGIDQEELYERVDTWINCSNWDDLVKGVVSE
jgi:hypothetical protein